MKKLFDERELVKKVLEQEVREPGLILHYCENTEIDRSNLQIFQRITETKDFSDEYQRSIRTFFLLSYRFGSSTCNKNRTIFSVDFHNFLSNSKNQNFFILIS